MAIKLITNNNLTFTKTLCNCGIKSIKKKTQKKTNKKIKKI